MCTIEQIRAAIEQLPQDEFFRLRNWFQERFATAWDKQLKEDVRLGRLQAIAQEALAEHRAGRSTPFPADEK